MKNKSRIGLILGLIFVGITSTLLLAEGIFDVDTGVRSILDIFEGPRGGR